MWTWLYFIAVTTLYAYILVRTRRDRRAWEEDRRAWGKERKELLNRVREMKRVITAYNDDTSKILIER